MSSDESSRHETGNEETPQDWYFTFGAGQRLFAGHGGNDCQGEGINLDGAYIKLRGTFSETRAQMVKLFGRIWSSQYSVMPVLPYYMGPWRDLTPLLKGSFYADNQSGRNPGYPGQQTASAD